jgi:hypothetical protein
MDQDKCFFMHRALRGYSDTIHSTGNLEKEGIQLLEPHSNFNASFSIEIV